MITRKELDSLIKSLPRNISQEEWRTAACVATGVSYDKSLPDIIKTYSINSEVAKKWWNQFNFNDFGSPEPTKKKKGKTSQVLSDFVKNNIGKTITANLIADECKVSLPTVYNFINSNRSWFKKVGRGLYLVLDAEEERKNAKK